MRRIETRVHGVWIIEPETIEDERGFFARTFCADNFEQWGLSGTVSQCSISFSRQAGTTRGMHYQAAPHAEAKLVRCTQGAVFDVALDLRAGSPTFRKWVATELTAGNRRMLYVPEGCAHGFQTLVSDTEVHYQISVPFVPAAARGVRWNDPAFGIEWPGTPSRLMSARDAAYPDFEPGGPQ